MSWFNGSGGSFGFGVSGQAGSGGGGAALTFNPSDKNADITLTNGNLTVTDSGSNGRKMVRATRFINSGKPYFEVTVGSKGGQNVCIGWANSGHDLGSHVGFDADDRAYGFISNGRCYNFNSYGSGYTVYTGSDVIMVALDFTAGKIWWGVNGTWENSGDPANGTNPQFATVVAELMTPAVSTYENGQNLTANFGASSFAHTVPTGFTAVNNL